MATRAELADAPGLRERGKTERRERILAAAARLFARDGFAPTTTREIAREAGVGVGTVFVHFRDKDELLFEVFRASVGPVADAAFADLDAHAALVDQLVHVFGRLLAHYAADPALSRVFLGQLLSVAGSGRPEVIAFTFSFVQRLAELVARAQERGELGSGFSPVMAASNLFASFYLWLLASLTPFAPAGAAHLDLLAEALRLQVRGLVNDRPALPSPRPGDDRQACTGGDRRTP